MDVFLLILAIILLLIGILGCVVPIIPGPPISYASILILHFTKFGDFTNNFLYIFAGITIIVTVLDYIVPIWGTKKFGGSKAGVRGATAGLILGLFVFPPIGLIIGPFLGAFIAEMMRENNTNKAIRSGFGSLIGFLLGTGLKMAVSLAISFYFFKELF
ncbi:DUF456 domain-containing protein [Bacteroidota bacterium]